MLLRQELLQPRVQQKVRSLLLTVSSLSVIDTQPGGSKKEAPLVHTVVGGHRRCHQGLELPSGIYRHRHAKLHTKLSIASQTAVNECRCFHAHGRNETIWCWHLTLVPLRTKRSSCPVGFAWPCIICIGSIVISICSSGAMLHCTQCVARALQMLKKVTTKSGNNAKVVIKTTEKRQICCFCWSDHDLTQLMDEMRKWTVLA